MKVPAMKGVSKGPHTRLQKPSWPEPCIQQDRVGFLVPAGAGPRNPTSENCCGELFQQALNGGPPDG